MTWAAIWFDWKTLLVCFCDWQTHRGKVVIEEDMYGKVVTLVKKVVNILRTLL